MKSACSTPGRWDRDNSDGGSDANHLKWRDMAHTSVVAWPVPFQPGKTRLVACHEYTFPWILDPLSLRTLERGDASDANFN